MAGLILALVSASGFAETRVAITIDDLPIHGFTNAAWSRQRVFDTVLEAFKKHHISGVYGFVNAFGVAREPGSQAFLDQWIAAGNLLGNHTSSHLNLAKALAADYIRDIREDEPILVKLMGKKDYKYFRYPFLIEGNTLEKRNEVRKFLSKNGYRIAQVTIDFEDWAWNTAYLRCIDKSNTKRQTELEESFLKAGLSQLEWTRTLSKVLFNREIPQILLLHIGAMDARMMDTLLTEYEKKGVQFITLPEALKDEAYHQPDTRTLSTEGVDYLDQLMRARGLPYPAGAPDTRHFRDLAHGSCY